MQLHLYAFFFATLSSCTYLRNQKLTKCRSQNCNSQGVMGEFPKLTHYIIWCDNYTACGFTLWENEEILSYNNLKY